MGIFPPPAFHVLRLLVSHSFCPKMLSRFGGTSRLQQCFLSFVFHPSSSSQSNLQLPSTVCPMFHAVLANLSSCKLQLSFLVLA